MKIYLQSGLKNFNEIFRKNVSYDNIKSYKKPGLYPLVRKCSFGETTGVVKWNPPPAVFLGLICQKVPRIVFVELEKNPEMNSIKPNYI